MGEKPFPAWSWSVEQCLKEFNVKLDKGLSTYEAEKRRERHGWNELAKEKGKPLWRLVLEQFDDMLVKILLVAACISFILAYMHGGEFGQSGFEAYVEPFVIVLILVLNAIVGVWQESNAEKALEALKEMQCESGKVLRDGYFVPELPARELVPGDIVELRVGDKVPADMRVAALKTTTFRVEQSSLTGEAVPVLKGTDTIFLDDCELQAKENMVFAGTTVVNGSCLCIVVSTGMNTEIGKIQKQIHEASQEESDTPLKKKLDEFGSRLTTAIGLVCLIVWVINYKNFFSWDVVDGSPANIRFSFEKCTYYFKIAVALAVAAIPEGLPAVITTCLALGTRKMAQKNAIVRKLPSVETLGCTTVICSDKTGTLTTNQMSVTEFFTLGGKTTASRIFHVDGTTYDPKDGGIVDWTCYNMDANLQAMAEICAVCNDAGIYFDGRLYRATGLPTEAALKVLVEKMGVPDAKVRSKIREAQLAANYLIDSSIVKLGCCEWWMKRSKRVATLEFDRIRKSMSVIVREPTGHNRLLVKGAVESLLERTSQVQLADGSLVPMDEPCRQLLLLKLQEMSSKGLRCLGLAYKDDLGEFSDYHAESHPSHKKLLDPACYSSIESDLVFVGVISLRDPPRDEVHKAIEDCRGAGIKVMVITGDNKCTAEAICREINLFSKSEDLRGRSLTGKEFIALSSSQQIETLSKPGGKVFSRAEPGHKQEIVRMLKEMGEIVAMTGDGVNDAPALKLADIGIAMGITGTEVAKEASDMVLADDNFSTIVSAVAEGRSIYNNMKAFIRYMISSNVGEVISIFLTAALGIPECLIPVQLLWVNLVTDGPPATALGFNPADVDIMQKPPRRSDDALINSWVLLRYLLIGSYVGIATVGIFILWYTQPSFMGINLVSDGHTLVELSQLRNWGKCPTWSNFTVSPFMISGGRMISFTDPCDYFSIGKVKAMTLSLSVLVSIEMFNSLNALSEDNSLIKMPPWRNPWLLVAMSVSFGLHCLILYVPFLADVFGIVPLSMKEWILVVLISAPVILLEEVLKLLWRNQRWIGAKVKTE
ncbi:calcium-transporting ATPase, endoplasmic reticulum-type [Juglans microcarpa x Juglans regia]|uniref:calcium-transporting ATPase, endoplasmic reticulum-type n=1 Tax=Juglans microcarpa x Juglans regia TaxID=2249226 RepID=UPI001B7F3987|nr:calcium-transporting ATPase, endoplasmic reticulum-type [Juglans microcarpa x Juglans regia]XP_041006897.1 calcium-transporting ATPase, endoplasmic reticulum-type [Juglans microcarpa x Juglans regia]XP_041006906.1 calcium-transporting ATPase, endoplasmic reticulum-type [Juglans microcarpa x Juglans regia]XP_041006913.1 calcium-transporting ATPase, endoplasmic reticulum-type [Juglans microcarpa x Juglans regia]XP_041006921.1 calcium-transporting ATPase, endoplasmic reticulum-type [Juglans mic